MRDDFNEQRACYTQTMSTISKLRGFLLLLLFFNGRVEATAQLNLIDSHGEHFTSIGLIIRTH